MEAPATALQLLHYWMPQILLTGIIIVGILTFPLVIWIEAKNERPDDYAKVHFFGLVLLLFLLGGSCFIKDEFIPLEEKPAEAPASLELTPKRQAD